MKSTKQKFTACIMVLCVGVILLAVGPRASADEGTTVSGFVAAQLDVDIVGSKTNSTFRFDEGAVYLSKTMGEGMGFLDIPVLGSQSTAGVSNRNFGVGLSKAQGYLHYKYGNGFWWRMGQFDKIYGFEKADTKDRLFAEAGLIKGMTMPTGHLGAWLGYEFNENYGASFLVGNGGGVGNGTGRNAEFGGKFKWDVSNFHGNLGYLYERTRGGGTKSQLVDLNFGTSFDKMMVDFEVAYKKPAVGSEVFAFGGWFENQFTDMITGGLRAEYAKSSGSATTQAKVFNGTIGPKFAMTKAMTVALDYSFNSNTVGAASAATSHSFLLTGVHTL